MAKAGISGVGMLAVPIMAAIFGGKPSSDLVLPMLIIADAFAVVYYKRQGQWAHIWALSSRCCGGRIARTGGGVLGR